MLTPSETALANANNALIAASQFSGNSIGVLLNTIAELRQENEKLKAEVAKATPEPAAPSPEQGKVSG